MKIPTARFAPSPNGELHLGHALSAIAGFTWAREAGGRFLLRIEDIDIARAREEYVGGILEDLSWLGLAWDGPVLRQSRNLSRYKDVAQRLASMDLIYPCFASRAEIEAAAIGQPDRRDPDGAPLYPGIYKDFPFADAARRIAAGQPHAWRLHMDRALQLVRERLGGAELTFCEYAEDGSNTRVACRPELWGDCIVVRKDAPASYLLAVVTDDEDQGVTRVTRGRDLLAATDVQRLLHVLLGFAEPEYAHHRLITDATGRKLSKSAKDTSIRALRAGGATPADIRHLLGLG